jgi:tRNA (guanine-N7-)-methyltransferase
MNDVVDEQPEQSYPHARSFLPRRRALSPLRAAEYRRQAPRWRLDEQGTVLDLLEVFEDAGPAAHRVVLDIGFGGGEGLIGMAALRPDEGIIGVEVHTPGVAKVLQAVEEHGWRHVRVVEGDAIHFLSRIAPGSLGGVRLWFPDPWPKNKQKHRRIVRPDVVRAVAEGLRVGGVFHVATDVADYARHTQQVVSDEPRLAGGVVARPEWRPLTRFESRGIAAGRSITDLVYERIDRPTA